MVRDMEKCIEKAKKEHGVVMTKEKIIIDNLKHSKKWFLDTY